VVSEPQLCPYIYPFSSRASRLTVFNSGTFYFFGGLLMILASVLEFIVGNTFVFVVFGSFGMSESSASGFSHG
jgi:succinate-acetate transporter protein